MKSCVNQCDVNSNRSDYKFNLNIFVCVVISCSLLCCESAIKKIKSSTNYNLSLFTLVMLYKKNIVSI